MNFRDKTDDLDGKFLIGLRESLGLSTSEVAFHTLLSKKQIEQLEDGSRVSFYSEKIRAKAYTKVLTTTYLSSIITAMISKLLFNIKI
jgi:transcriptional regulator with XRE-family HTH domain